MSIWTVLIILGALGVLAYFAWPVLKEKLANGEIRWPQPRNVVETEPDPGQALAALPVGGSFRYDPEGLENWSNTRRVLYSTGVLHALNRNGQNFQPNGETYAVYTAEELLIMNFNGRWYIFNESRVLGREEANQFNEAGERFSNDHNRQQPGTVVIDWLGGKLDFQDVGYHDFELLAGNSHVPDGARIKFMLANWTLPDGSTQAVYLENQKTGTDRLWFGFEATAFASDPTGHPLSRYISKFQNT